MTLPVKIHQGLVLGGLSAACLAIGCGSPEQRSAQSLPADSTAARLEISDSGDDASSPEGSIPGGERAGLERLAARVDLLRVLRSDLAREEGSKADQSTWKAGLRAVDEDLQAFLAGHPRLHPATEHELAVRVTLPLEALRRSVVLDAEEW